MRIAYSGMFLGEGLRGLGHEVVALPLRQDSAFDDLIAATCPAPDLVLLERSPLAAPVAEVSDIKVLAAVKDGETVYTRGN